MDTALNVAKYIINKCTEDENPISNLQLQKIMYFAQKESLEKKLGPLFAEDFQAWQYGPVCPEVYRVFCGYGAMSIESRYDIKLDLSDKQINVIDAVVEEKRILPVWKLVEQSHCKNGAWDRVYADGLGAKQIIEQDLIRKHG